MVFNEVKRKDVGGIIPLLPIFAGIAAGIATAVKNMSSK